MRKRLHSLPLHEIRIHDGFWSRYIQNVRNGLAYQWEALNDRLPDAEKSYCMHNFKVAAGLEEGEFGGMCFQDSDVAKWLEGVAYYLELNPDEELERTADEAIDIIGKAQKEDGYLNTYYILGEYEKRFTCLRDRHELYCAGHFMEAAVAYYYATGKDKLLKIICRYADLICDTFGDGEGQISAYPGHPEIELALMRLYEATGVKRYADLARFFIERRGTEPDYFEIEKNRPGYVSTFDPSIFNDTYYQVHAPIREQKTAEGHAVRDLYLFTGVADVAGAYEDESLLNACETLFDNISQKRMYITGSIGSAAGGERFTCDYDLPNHSNYSESCASIALAMFTKRMVELERDAKYADVMERALYNTVLAGISLEGKNFFYVNPLEVIPEVAEKNTDLRHVKDVRQKWFGCACCPPNIIRTLASLGQYVYSVDEESLYVNLYVANETACTIGENKVSLKLDTAYPFEGAVKLSLSCAGKSPFAVALRIPQFTQLKGLKVDGVCVDAPVMENGYLLLSRCWEGDHTIQLELDMPARLIYANAKVRADIGKACVVKGPLVYCLEQADNGENLGALELLKDTELRESYDPALFGGTTVISAQAARTVSQDDALYTEKPPKKELAELKFVPYCFWNNRGKGEMLVWVRCETK